MGAMENWGLVTYRTTAVLFEEGKSDARYKNRVAYVVAHGKTFRKHGDTLSNSLPRTCPSVVRQSRYYGLVERALAERRLCYLGWLARC